MAFLNPQDAELVRNRFRSDLKHDVTLEFFAPSTGGLVLPGQDGETADYTRSSSTTKRNSSAHSRSPTLSRTSPTLPASTIRRGPSGV